MISWFEIAYTILNIIIIIFCSKSYFSSKKRPFQLIALGFICLIISDFIWLLALIPWLNIVANLYGYIRLGLYTAFILLILRALQLFDSNPSPNKKNQRNKHQTQAD